MGQKFYDRLTPPSKTVTRSLTMSADDWDVVEAYRCFVASLRGCEIPLQTMLREIIADHIESDRNFKKDKAKWSATSRKIEEARV